MSISQFQYLQMIERMSAGKTLHFKPPEAVVREMDLHDDIIAHCNQQRPRWKYIRANPVVESTIAEGSQDFTLFLPVGRLLCIECKSKTGKLSPKQLAWRLEMEMLGHTVHVVRSFSEFLSLVTEATKGHV